MDWQYPSSIVNVDHEIIRARNRKNVRLISFIDMLISAYMLIYFSYKFAKNEMSDLTRPPFSPGKWRGFGEMLFGSICITYSLQLMVASLLLTTTWRSTTLENACAKCQVWICISHFLYITLAVEFFIQAFNLLRPGASTEQLITFSIGMAMCIGKFMFRFFSEKAVKTYLEDLYTIPGVNFFDEMYYSSQEALNRTRSRIDYFQTSPPFGSYGFEKDPQDLYDIV